MAYNLDAEQRNQDWTKKTWDLPPYKSPEFMKLFPDLEGFRLLPIYQWAMNAGLIKDDEWVGPNETVLSPRTWG